MTIEINNTRKATCISLVEKLFFATCFMQLHMLDATFFNCIKHIVT